MCYNCGCGIPDDDMGHPQNITNKTFAEAARAMSQSEEEAKKNTLELLQKQEISQGSKQTWLLTRCRRKRVGKIYLHLSGIIPFVGKF